MNVAGLSGRSKGLLSGILGSQKCFAAAAILCSSTALGAEPFAIDTSQMPGFTVVTAEDGRMSAWDMVVVEYEGPIAYPMAESLRAIWDHVRSTGRFNRFVLRLNSAGGVGLHGEDVITILDEIRDEATLDTLVADNDLCASMCVGIFVQGENRFASPASAWMFHGASSYMSNQPNAELTARYFDLFHDRAIEADFIDFLYSDGKMLSPGAFWMSGSDLAGESNIITDLLPNWRPAEVAPGLPLMIHGGI